MFPKCLYYVTFNPFQISVTMRDSSKGHLWQQPQNVLHELCSLLKDCSSLQHAMTAKTKGQLHFIEAKLSAVGATPKAWGISYMNRANAFRKIMFEVKDKFLHICKYKT